MARNRTRRDVFPTTAMTWLADCLDRGEPGRAEALRHVMEVYRLPLEVYVRGSSFVRVGDPTELVDGFFADRLEKDAYLSDWRASGRPLRRWLLTGLRFFLMEEIRREQGQSHGPPPYDAPDPEGEEPGTPFWRALGRGFVREAMRRAEAEMNSEGLGAHWRVFLLHYLGGRGHAEAGAAVGVDARRAAVMARTASRRFRQRLREMVSWPGATDDEIDAELRRICEG